MTKKEDKEIGASVEEVANQLEISWEDAAELVGNVLIDQMPHHAFWQRISHPAKPVLQEIKAIVIGAWLVRCKTEPNKYASTDTYNFAVAEAKEAQRLLAEFKSSRKRVPVHVSKRAQWPTEIDVPMVRFATDERVLERIVEKAAKAGLASSKRGPYSRTLTLEELADRVVPLLRRETIEGSKVRALADIIERIGKLGQTDIWIDRDDPTKPRHWKLGMIFLDETNDPDQKKNIPYSLQLGSFWDEYIKPRLD